MSCSSVRFPSNIAPPEKHNIIDEKKALVETLEVLEKELKGNLFLSKTQSPDLGDLAVFGTLRATEGLSVHATTVLGNDGIAAWYQRMKLLTPSMRVDQ